MTGVSPYTLEGFVDHADWHGMRGWAYDRATPDTPLWLEVQVDDQTPVAFLANMRRQDLVDAGYGRGTFAFELRFPHKLDPLLPHRIDVRGRQSGLSLPNSPSLLAAAPMASAERRSGFEAAVEAEIAAAHDGAELDTTIGFLLRQVEKLLWARADAQSGVTALHQFRLRWNDYLAGERAKPLQPDARPWALVIDADLPDTPARLAIVRAMQGLGYRVAVIGTRNLASHGAVAQALAAMDVTVLGEPQFFTVEDVLRRHRGLFRAVLLHGPMLGAAYGVVAHLHQPRAKLITMLGEGDASRTDAALLFAAALQAEYVVVETEAMQKTLAQRLPGRQIDLLAPESDDGTTAALLERLLPRLRISQQPANPQDAPAPA